MSVLESRFSSQEINPALYGQEIGQAWEAFGWRVAQQCQVDLAQSGAGVLVELPGTGICLIVQNVGDGFYAIAYGERVEGELLPQVQIVFDASGEAGWMLVWVEYSDNIWHEFLLSQGASSNDPTEHERYVDFEEFAGYVLAKLEHEGWTTYAANVNTRQNSSVTPAPL